MNFPPDGFSEKEDSRFFKTSQEDSTIRSDTEGGYEHARPRFTRTPRKTYNTGFTLITNSQLETLESFWDDHQGYKIFTWTHPTRGTTHNCRFTKPFETKYSGVGLQHRYDVQIEFKEV